MLTRLTRAAAALLLTLAAPSAAQADRPITAEALMRHIEVLAGDDFEGRLPATEGERRTISYIATQLQARGVEPAAAGGGWFQAVTLLERRPVSHDVRWTANGRRLAFDERRITLIGSEAGQRIADAPLVFVGHGVVDPARGIDQLAGADLEGAVALMLVEPPPVPDFPSFRSRVRAVASAGASAVIGIVDDSIPWQAVVAAGADGETVVDIGGVPAVFGSMPAGEAARLVRAAGGDLASLLNEQAGPSFRAVPLDLRATLYVRSHVRRYTSHNVVGRLRGRESGGESVLVLGHWDHLGICRPEGTDRICNGAVDNASGIATLIEVAGRLARGRRPERDVLFLATTAEEIGLLGAEFFAARPPVALETIVAALNLDTVAVNPAGTPLGVVGRGIPALDEAIAAVAAEMGRTMDTGHGADAFVRRQDGWALSRAGVPAVLVGGNLVATEALRFFLATAYHSPVDEPGGEIELGGAVGDANLLVALARRLATPALYRRPQSRPM